MKSIKLIAAPLLLLVIFLSFGRVFANVVPTYKSTVPKDVYGFLQLYKDTDIYEQPSRESRVLTHIDWDKSEVYFNKYKLDPSQVFAVFIPDNDYTFFYVIDEEDGWYKILYDKKNVRYGWVQALKHDDFWMLKDFYTHFGKKNSLYYMKDVDTRTRTLKSGPSDESQSLQGFTVTRNIKLVMIRGNWAMVSIIDYESTVPKTGYIKWRGTDGTIYLFPQMY